MAMTTEEQRQAQSLSQTQPLSHGERISRLEAIIETVLPHLATKEDLAKAEMRIVKWVIGTGISVVMGVGGLLILLLD